MTWNAVKYILLDTFTILIVIDLFLSHISRKQKHTMKSFNCQVECCLFARLVHCIKFVFLPVFGMRVCPSPRICQFRAIYSADRAPRDWHVASIDSWTGRCSIANRKIVEYFDWRRSHRRPSPFFTNCRYVTTLTSETLECRLPQSRINIKKIKINILFVRSLGGHKTHFSSHQFLGARLNVRRPLQSVPIRAFSLYIRRSITVTGQSNGCTCTIQTHFFLGSCFACTELLSFAWQFIRRGRIIIFCFV